MELVAEGLARVVIVVIVAETGAVGADVEDLAEAQIRTRRKNGNQ